MKFFHCDVFAKQPFSGNSLAVFPEAGSLTHDQMLGLTQELRHFESAFVTAEPSGDRGYATRVFDLFEELPFAGHPLLGTAAVLHQMHEPAETAKITLQLGDRKVAVSSQRVDNGYVLEMDQGQPNYIAEVGADRRAEFAACFSLTEDDLHPDLPLEVVSTGLKYLVVPLRSGLDRAAICVPDLEERLEALGAEFAYLLDVDALEGRHWNNDGLMEDVATGSAAGVVAAYTFKHGLIEAGKTYGLSQGRFVGRDSRIDIAVWAEAGDITSIRVGGRVVIIGTGAFTSLPGDT